MKDLYLRSSLSAAFVWAIFTLGTTQLALVLGGSLVGVLATLCSAVIFAFFLFKFQEVSSRSVKRYLKTYLSAAGILFILENIYLYLALLDPGFIGLIVSFVHFIVFLIPVLFVLPFLKTSAHVSR